MAYYIIKPWYGKSSSSATTMTVILDLTNSDPTQWATYADDAVGMVAGSDAWDEFFGHYPCILDNGVELGKLKRDNFAQYEDGTTAPITTLGKDVMIAFPRRGIKIEYTDENTLSVSMTNEKRKTGYSYMAHSYKGNNVNKFYLGAYKGYVSSNNLYSTSGQTPTVSQTIGTFRTNAQNRGTGYEQSAYYQLIFRQVMYLLKYKGQNAQDVIGRGFVDGNSAVYGAMGYTNDKGMDWGESTGKLPMKLFGLEDFYGNIWEFIDGIYLDSNRRLTTADGNFNDTGSNYTQVSSTTASSDWIGYLRYPVGTSEAGFAPLANNSNKGSARAYFCDYSYIGANRLGLFGGGWADADVTGVFLFYALYGPTYVNTYIGSRLMYLPTT